MDRALRAGVLGVDPHQHRHTSGAVAQARTRERADAVAYRDGREHRYVARAIRHRRDELAPRLHALGVEYVLPDVLGLVHVHRHDWAVSRTALFVPAIPADDFDF